jgi:hypothetical protein
MYNSLRRKINKPSREAVFLNRSKKLERVEEEGDYVNFPPIPRSHSVSFLDSQKSFITFKESNYPELTYVRNVSETKPPPLDHRNILTNCSQFLQDRQNIDTHLEYIKATIKNVNLLYNQMIELTNQEREEESLIIKNLIITMVRSGKNLCNHLLSPFFDNATRNSIRYNVVQLKSDLDFFCK